MTPETAGLPPVDVLARAQTLLAGASSAELPTRAIYLATARALLLAHAEDVRRAQAMLAAMEAELVRVTSLEAAP